MDGWNSFFIWLKEFHVYVALADLESNICHDVFSCLDKEIKHNDWFRVDFN